MLICPAEIVSVSPMAVMAVTYSSGIVALAMNAWPALITSAVSAAAKISDTIRLSARMFVLFSSSIAASVTTTFLPSGATPAMMSASV